MEQILSRAFLGAVALALASCAACVAGGANPAGDVLRPVPGDGRPVRVASASGSADGRRLEAVVDAPTGIFALEMAVPRRLEQLVLRVPRARRCEGLSLERPGGALLELRDRPGVLVEARGDEVVVVFEAPALEAIAPGGRLQFVNEYR